MVSPSEDVKFSNVRGLYLRKYGRNRNQQKNKRSNTNAIKLKLLLLIKIETLVVKKVQYKFISGLWALYNYTFKIFRLGSTKPFLKIVSVNKAFLFCY